MAALPQRRALTCAVATDSAGACTPEEESSTTDSAICSARWCSVVAAFGLQLLSSAARSAGGAQGTVAVNALSQLTAIMAPVSGVSGAGARRLQGRGDQRPSGTREMPAGQPGRVRVNKLWMSDQICGAEERPSGAHVCCLQGQSTDLSTYYK